VYDFGAADDSMRCGYAHGTLTNLQKVARRSSKYFSITRPAT
jgi:hypothetical protein